MPILKQLSCHIEWPDTGIAFQEYGTVYGDGLVETFIVTPTQPQTFTIRLTSKGFISEGLSALVFVDGQYQCNRNRLNLRPPKKGRSRNATEVNFRMRQKEKATGDGTFIGREWRFDRHNIISDAPDNADAAHFDELGNIKVLVLRCKARFSPDGSRSGSDSGADRSPIGSIVGEPEEHETPKNFPRKGRLKAVEKSVAGSFDGCTNSPDRYDDLELSKMPRSLGLDGTGDMPGSVGYGGGPPLGTWPSVHQPQPAAPNHPPHNNGPYAMHGTSAWSQNPQNYHHPPHHSGLPQFVFPAPTGLRLDRRVHFDHGNFNETHYGQSQSMRHGQPVQYQPMPDSQNPSANSAGCCPTRTMYDSHIGRASSILPGYSHTGNEYSDFHTSQPPYVEPAHPNFAGPGYAEPGQTSQYGLPANVSYNGSIHLTPGSTGQYPGCPAYYQRAPQINIPYDVPMHPDPRSSRLYQHPPQPHWPLPQQQHGPSGGSVIYVPEYQPTPNQVRIEVPFSPGRRPVTPLDVYGRCSPGPRPVTPPVATFLQGNYQSDNPSGNVGDNTNGGAQQDSSVNSNDRTNASQNPVQNDSKNCNNNGQSDEDWAAGADQNTNQNQTNDSWGSGANNWSSGNDSAGNKDTTSNDTSRTNASPQNNTGAWGSSCDNNDTNNNDTSGTTSTFDPNSVAPRTLYGPHGPYFTHMSSATSPDIPAEVEEEPRYDVPQSIANHRGSSRQVQPGRGYLYHHKCCTPEYMDTAEEPYARFVFKYRTKEQLKNEIGVEVETEPSSDSAVQSLQNLSKDEMIQMLLQAQNALGGQLPPVLPTTKNAVSPARKKTPAVMQQFAVPPPDRSFLKYKLPQARTGLGISGADTGGETNNEQPTDGGWGSDGASAAPEHTTSGVWGSAPVEQKSTSNWETASTEQNTGGSWDTAPAPQTDNQWGPEKPQPPNEANGTSTRPTQPAPQQTTQQQASQEYHIPPQQQQQQQQQDYHPAPLYPIIVQQYPQQQPIPPLYHQPEESLPFVNTWLGPPLKDIRVDPGPMWDAPRVTSKSSRGGSWNGSYPCFPLTTTPGEPGPTVPTIPMPPPQPQASQAQKPAVQVQKTVTPAPNLTGEAPAPSGGW